MASNEDILQFSNFKHGYITDGADFPKESVQDCANLDFEENRIGRRKPYHFQEDLSSYLPAGYTILGMYNKVFTDGTGTEKSVLVAVVKNLSSPYDVKIFVSDYYNPASTYGNYTTGTAGWTDTWQELTKTYTKTIDVATEAAVGSGQLLKVTGDSELQGLDENELRGWFVSISGVIQGIVTKFVPNNAGKSEIYIARGNKITNADTDSEALSLFVVGTEEIKISRFPVNVYNSTFFGGTGTTNFVQATFEEVPNAVKITCGKVGRVLWLGFLKEKTFFGDAANINSSDYEYSPDWNGIWFGYDCLDVNNKDVVYLITSADGYNQVASPVIAIDSVKKESGSVGTPVARTGTGSISFHKKDDYKEFGFILRANVSYFTIMDAGTAGASTSEYWASQLNQLVLEIDGMQAIYFASFVGRRCWDITATPDNYNLCNIKPTVLFNPEFDRRYSAYLHFYGKGTNDRVNEFDTTKDVTNLISFQLSDNYNGTVKYNSNKHDADTGGASPTFCYYLETINDPGPPVNSLATNPFQNTDQRIKLSLKSYLNMSFWKDLLVKAEKFIKVGEDIIAVGLSDDSVSSDSTQDKNGAFKIAISNIQNAGGNNAHSLFSDERVRQITLGEKLITGESIVGQQFLLFTSRDCYYYELPDNVAAIPLKHMKFENAGTYSSRTLIKAQYAGQYAGIYWIGKRGIYRFLDNKPENITENRWEKEFELYTDAEKALAVMGFLPRTMDIFVIMPKYVSVGVYTYKIFLWNIKQQNWRKYTYTDRPIAMVNSADEEMWFLSGTNGNYLFKTATPAEAAAKGYDTRNATPTKVDVVIMLEKMFTHGSRKTYKTFSRVEMAYKHNESDGQVKYTARGNGSSTNDLLVWQKAIDESRAGYGIDTIDITAGYTDGTQIKARKAVNWYNLKIETIGDNTTPGFGEFVIDEIIVAGEQRGRTVNR